MRYAVVLLALTVAVTGCGGPRTVTLGAVHIGSTVAAVTDVWGQSKDCAAAGKKRSCEYTAHYRKDLDVTVIYDHGRAAHVWVAFQASDGDSPSGTAYSALLDSLIPAAAQRIECRDLAQTQSNQGPTRACLYRYRGKPLMVAHFLTPTGLHEVGTVDLGYGWGFIQRGP